MKCLCCYWHSSGDLILHVFFQAIPCNVTGVWRNELGSVLAIEAVGSELRGLYQSAVATAPGVTGPEQAKLLGVTGNQGLQTSVAFSVLWEAGV